MDKPGHFWFHDTVSALAYSLAQTYEQSDVAYLQPPYNDLTHFVLRQWARMPDYLRTPMLAATLGFDFEAILRSGGLFHHLPPAPRRQQVAAWKGSKLGPKRDLIRYYESLVTLALYSRASEPGVERSTSPPSAVEINSGGVLAEPPPELRSQIVVVGSGPGGAVTACLLAEAGRNVLLIEEGPFYPLESCVPFSKAEMLQKYRNGGQTVALGKSKIAYVEGCCVGGGSEINSGLYHRTPPSILERWRSEFHVEALTENELRPHFETCEREVCVSPLPGPAPLASLKLREGAQRLGWKSLEVPRWFRYDSNNAAQGTRQSMTKTYVPRFLNAGGTLLPRTRVTRIRRENDKWTLTAMHGEGGGLRIQAETLFLCGGAIQTPALLRHSGIRRHVGESLQLHPTVKVTAKFPETVNSAEMGVPVHQVKEFAPRLSFGCSISTPAYLALGLLDYPQAARDLPRTWPDLANYYAMITSEGSGTVRSLGRFRDALVRYHLTENDRRALAEGLRKLSETLFAAGAVALYPSVAHTIPLVSQDDLSRLPEILPTGLASLMTIHLFSSCPMGEDKSKCAADSFGRMHGLDSLFIADASLLCTAPSVNPQGTIMALARRNALHFLHQL